MRICSFLPSATEMLYALGAGESLSGVTFECDYPPEAAEKAIVVRTLLESGLGPEEIDDAVRRQLAAGGSLYAVDLDKLREMQPDLVITQDLCNVCALNASDVARAIGELESRPEVVALAPHTLEDVFADIEVVGKAAGRSAQAGFLVRELRARVALVKHNVLPGVPPRVLCLEWLAPPFQGGHWIPQMVMLAGGEPVLAVPGERSVRLLWQQVLEADPEVLVIMPCGFHLRETIAQFRELTLPDGWKNISAVKNDRVYAVDGTAYFSRPGPRLIDGVEILQAILNGGPFVDLPVDSVRKL